VIRLRETGAHEGVLYLVLDLAEGRSLAEVLGDGPIGVDRTVAISEQLADALAHAHGLGVVHRDVKPSNILSADADRVCPGDFGIARLLGSISLTCTGRLIGSGPYLAPEQVTGEAVGPAADMYSLALVMIECIAGHRCYGGGRRSGGCPPPSSAPHSDRSTGLVAPGPIDHDGGRSDSAPVGAVRRRGPARTERGTRPRTDCRCSACSAACSTR
jgi:serine/threonine protein kinase